MFLLLFLIDMPFFFNPNQTLKSNVVLLYGATSFLGSKAALALHQSGYNIKPIDDIEHIPLEPVAWYRWQKLQELNLNSQFIKINNDDHMFFNHTLDTILFVPTPLFNGSSIPDRLVDIKVATKIAKNFVTLLETAIHIKCRVVLLTVSQSTSTSMQNAWLRALELSLLAYQGLGVQGSIIRMDGVYGSWEGQGDGVHPIPGESCLYIEEVVNALLTVFNKKENLVIDLTKNCDEQSESWKHTVLWADQYTKYFNNNSRNVVISTYFTDVKNPSHPFQMRPRNGLFMKEWFVSAIKQGIDLVIFYDNFTDAFEKRVKEIHPNTEFIRVESLHGRSTNDYRFYLTHRYILEHPEIGRAILTDMRDVKFVGDPFKQMKVTGDYLYVGMDNPGYLSGFEYEWVRNLMKKCHKADSEIDEVKLFPFLNAGVTGGTRHFLLAFFYLMTHYFDEAPHRENCDMGILSIVGHKHFHDHMFTGYPYQRSFAIQLATPQGLSLKHKNAEKYYVYR